jgi:NTP pyrophosphatase (non-canonical NTP hydrolase)
MNKKELYKKALKKWKHYNQLLMLEEESIELALAVHKLARERNGTNLNDVEEEIADVEIMIEQYKIMFPINDIIKFKKKKLKRLEGLLNEKNKKKESCI